MLFLHYDTIYCVDLLQNNVYKIKLNFNFIIKIINLLTGILITSISYNYMLTVPYVQTPKQARAAAAQFLANKKNAQTSADAAKSSAPVYQTDGK